jgi:hypothetical protein
MKRMHSPRSSCRSHLTAPSLRHCVRSAAAVRRPPLQASRAHSATSDIRGVRDCRARTPRPTAAAEIRLVAAEANRELAGSYRTPSNDDRLSTGSGRPTIGPSTRRDPNGSSQGTTVICAVTRYQSATCAKASDRVSVNGGIKGGSESQDGVRNDMRRPRASLPVALPIANAVIAHPHDPRSPLGCSKDAGHLHHIR